MISLNGLSVKSLAIIILAISIAIHFAYFGHPSETVFDEVHFGKFISGYFTGEYFFDIHPPLGKLLISGMGWLTGFEPGFDFANIGQGFPNNSYLWLRLLPILAGTLLPLVIFLLALKLGLSRLASFLAGILIALDNALLVQSRFILLDSFLLLFGFAALLFYFKYREQILNSRFLFLSGLFGAFAISIKWTGMTFLAIIIILEALRQFKEHGKGNGMMVFGKSVMALIVLPFVIYFLVFAIHFGLLDKSGPGDAFMTPSFRKTLTGTVEATSPDVEPLGIFSKFIELSGEMYSANARLSATHPYSSKWYTWQFMARPIYYWNGGADDTGNQARIYFLGNPIIWWASSVAMIFLLLVLLESLLRKFYKNEANQIYSGLVPWLFAGAFMFNLLPFIGVSRVLFLYHYLSAYIFAILTLAYLSDKLPEKSKKIAALCLVLASLIFFLYFAPLSYGLPLGDANYNARAWFASWR